MLSLRLLQAALAAVNVAACINGLRAYKQMDTTPYLSTPTAVVAKPIALLLLSQAAVVKWLHAGNTAANSASDALPS
jgi:hypothetical protein